MTPHLWLPRDTSPAAGDEFRRLAGVTAAHLARPGASTPVLFIDRDRLRAGLARWRAHLPHVPPYYAVKANIDPLVLRELFAGGARADVASAFEIEVCRAVGLTGDRMILSNPRKDRDTILAMKAARAFAVAVDSEEEVDKLVAEGVPSGDYNPVLFVRVKVPTKGVTLDLSSKFGVRVLPKGIDPDTRPRPAVQVAAVLPMFRRAGAAGFRTFGLSFHVGTQCSNPAVYRGALEVCEELIAGLRAAGVAVNWLDLGGGFADGPTLAARGTSADELLAALTADTKRLAANGLNLLAEPGRHLIADAGALVARVTYERDTEATGRRVQIDDGVFRTLSGRVHDEKEYRFAAARLGGDGFLSAHAPFAVWGCSCDSFDKVADAVELPADLRVGDLLVVPCLGAYSTSFGSNTNGFQPAACVLWWEEGGAVRFADSPLALQNAVLLNHLRNWAATASLPNSEPPQPEFRP